MTRRVLGESVSRAVLLLPAVSNSIQKRLLFSPAKCQDMEQLFSVAVLDEVVCRGRVEQDYLLNYM